MVSMINYYLKYMYTNKGTNTFKTKDVVHFMISYEYIQYKIFQEFYIRRKKKTWWSSIKGCILKATREEIHLVYTLITRLNSKYNKNTFSILIHDYLI